MKSSVLIDAAPASSSIDALAKQAPDGGRRQFLRRAAVGAALGQIMALASCGEGEESPLAGTNPTPTPTATATPTILPVTDTDMIVLMLQLHYLQAEFYSRAILGAPLPASLTGGTGTAGDVTGPRPVTITDPILADILREVAAEKIDQVVRLRAVLGASTPARPAMNLAANADGVFGRYNALASAPTSTVNSTASAAVIGDVYASQEQFLLGAFLIEDAVMAAWRSVATLMVSATNIDIAAGMLSVSAAHAGLVRSQLFIRGAASGSQLRQSTIRLSDIRDSFAPVDDDRGVAAGTSGSNLATADITPADGEGEIYGRLPNLTINTFYMTQATATSGGFFPAGLNGVLKESSANSG